MRCLNDCHLYELETFMGDKDTFPRQIRFYEMRENGDKVDGVTNEEVIKVLIHRLTYLNEVWLDGKFKCSDNYEAIDCLERALHALERRTRNREARRVEGTHNP